MICIKCHKEAPDGLYCALCGAKQTVSARVTHKRGNGQGSVIKRGKTFTAVATVGHYITSDGKYHTRRQWKSGFRTRSEAVAYLPTMIEEAKRAADKKVVTFRSLWEAYQDGAYTKLGNSKQVAYRKAGERWEDIMDRDITDTTLGELQAVLKAKTSTYYPAKDMQNVLSHLYKIAIADGTTTVNLARMLVLPELEEDSPEPFTEGNVQTFWEAYGKGDHFAAYVLAMVYSGAMPGELLAMKADMIDFEHREIRGCGLKTKKRKEVPIVFPALLVPVMEDLIAHAGRTGRIVPIQKDNFYKQYYEFLERVEVQKLPPYSCRHTTATALALDGRVAVSAIQEVMRHSKLSTTQRYIHTSSTDAHNAIEFLNPQTNQQTSQ